MATGLSRWDVLTGGLEGQNIEKIPEKKRSLLVSAVDRDPVIQMGYTAENEASV